MPTRCKGCLLLKSQMQGFHKDHDKLKDENSKLKNGIITENKRAELCKDKVLDLSDISKGLQQDVKKLKDENQEMFDEIEGLKKENAELKDTLKTTEFHEKQLRDPVANLYKQIRDLKKENAELTQLGSEYDPSVDQLVDKKWVEDLQKENDRLKNSAKQLIKQITEEQGNYNKEMKKRKASILENMRYKDKILELEEEIIVAEGQYQQLKKKSEVVRVNPCQAAEIEKLKKENEELKLYKDGKKSLWLHSPATIELKKDEAKSHRMFKLAQNRLREKNSIINQQARMIKKMGYLSYEQLVMMANAHVQCCEEEEECAAIIARASKI
jgi:chromosome segregation ATPase